MENPTARRDAISRVKTNLDKILEETEYVLRNSKHKTSSIDRKAGQTPMDDQALAEETRRTTSKFEMVNVLLQILQKQEELTVEEYTIDNSTFKVLVIEDTEF